MWRHGLRWTKRRSIHTVRHLLIFGQKRGKPCFRGTIRVWASWRNWQTRWIQNPLPVRAYRFDSDRGHSSFELPAVDHADPFFGNRLCPFDARAFDAAESIDHFGHAPGAVEIAARRRSPRRAAPAAVAEDGLVESRPDRIDPGRRYWRLVRQLVSV